MSEALNEIHAYFGKLTTTTTAKVSQWAYGQKLIVHDADLPSVFEAYYSNSRSRGEAKPQIGTDGEAPVPDEYFLSGADIYVFLMEHEGADDGRYRKIIHIPIDPCSQPSDVEPSPVQQNVIDQAIAALNDAVEQTGEDKEATAALAEAAAASSLIASEAAQSAQGSATSASGSATTASNAAQTATTKAGEAAQSASEAESARASARNYAASASDSASDADTAKTAAQSAAQTATTKATEASISATSAAGSASAASVSASQASESATSAANSATAASGSATSAAGSATTASTKASEASASATGAATAKTGAEAAQTAAETAQGKAEDAQAAAETTAQGISASAAQIATNTADIAELKSEVSALPTDGVVANSKQLLSENGTDNTEPYTFRAVPVNADRAELDAVVGGTVAWNQLAGYSAPTTPTTINGVTFTPNGDGSVTVSGTATAQTTYNYGVRVSCPSNHKRLMKGCPSGGSASTYRFKDGYASASDTGNGLIEVVNSDYSVVQIVIANGYTANNLKFTPQIFDLTQMFGSTIADYIYSLEQSTAGAGVAFFRKLFPKDYYPYDAGTLKSVESVSSHDMVGFNQWDEEWENGRFNLTTGEKSSDNGLASKNKINVFPNTTYYANCGVGYGSTLVLLYYDADENFISYDIKYSPKISFTTPNNARYLNFNLQTSFAVNTYNHDICINLSDPVKNGTYEPYVKHSYPLDGDVTLRGIPKLADGKLSYDGDRYLPDGTVKRRYGIVDLGTLTWTYRTDVTTPIFSSNLSTYAKRGSARQAAPIACAAYTPVTSENVSQSGYDKSIAISADGYRVYVQNSTYTSAETFKTAMSGVYLVYELATLTTETADPYQSLQVCDPNGTEEFVSTGIVPVGHETRYPENLRAKIEGLPWDFSSLIAPTEKTTTASRNYTTGSLLIMNNVLYKVTANIANGGTITPGTNVTATTLSEVILALQ